MDVARCRRTHRRDAGSKTVPSGTIMKEHGIKYMRWQATYRIIDKYTRTADEKGTYDLFVATASIGEGYGRKTLTFFATRTKEWGTSNMVFDLDCCAQDDDLDLGILEAMKAVDTVIEIRYLRNVIPVQRPYDVLGQSFTAGDLTREIKEVVFPSHKIVQSNAVTVDDAVVLNERYDRLLGRFQFEDPNVELKIKSMFATSFDISQKKTVLEISEKIVNRGGARPSSDDRVLFIHGPPGTGKTTTLVAILSTLMHSGVRVMFCASSNKAVQEALIRLRTHFPHFNVVLLGRDEGLLESDN